MKLVELASGDCNLIVRKTGVRIEAKPQLFVVLSYLSDSQRLSSVVLGSREYNSLCTLTNIDIVPNALGSHSGAAALHITLQKTFGRSGQGVFYARKTYSSRIWLPLWETFVQSSLGIKREQLWCLIFPGSYSRQLAPCSYWVCQLMNHKKTTTTIRLFDNRRQNLCKVFRTILGPCGTSRTHWKQIGV